MPDRTRLAAAVAAVLVAGGSAAAGAALVPSASERTASGVGSLEVTSASAELDLADVAATTGTDDAEEQGVAAATPAPAVVPTADPSADASDDLADPSGSGATAPVNPDPDGISAAEAIAIAQGRVAGTVLEVELSVERGRTVFEVEILAADGRRFEVEVDAADGAVLEVEEDDDRDDRDDDRDDDDRVWDGLTGTITPDEAVAAAVAEVGGGDRIEVERDEHRGRAAYEVDLRVDGRELEVYVDALTGDVLEVEDDD